MKSLFDDDIEYRKMKLITNIVQQSFVMCGIDDEQLELWELVHCKGHNLHKVSEELGITYDACKKRLNRIDKLMRKRAPRFTEMISKFEEFAMNYSELMDAKPSPLRYI